MSGPLKVVRIMTENWHASALPYFERADEIPEPILAEAIRSMTRNDSSPEHTGDFLTRLARKGETENEIVAAVKVLREQMVPLKADTVPILDTCGTGGDGSGTFNISTAVSIVLAGAGVPVVKHGNRSASSKSGSADVLAELGVPIDRGTDWAERCVREFGYAFCFAPHFHPSLKHVAPVRKALGIRTIFNLLGPLLNPANATHQLLGVASAELLPILAGSLAKLGTTSAFIVRNREGLDEISLSAPTDVVRVSEGRVRHEVWSPEEFGLDPVALSQLQVNSPSESARTILGVLNGEDGPARRVVLANVAAGLLLVGRAVNLRDGVELGMQAVDSGKAVKILERLRQSAN